MPTVEEVRAQLREQAETEAKEKPSIALDGVDFGVGEAGTFFSVASMGDLPDDAEVGQTFLIRNVAQTVVFDGRKYVSAKRYKKEHRYKPIDVTTEDTLFLDDVEDPADDESLVETGVGASRIDFTKLMSEAKSKHPGVSDFRFRPINTRGQSDLELKFGKYANYEVSSLTDDHDGRSYLRWMLGEPFPEAVKDIIKHWLGERD